MGSFEARIEVSGRLVAVQWIAHAREGDLSATVLELREAGAQVLVVGSQLPPSVSDLVERGVVEQVGECGSEWLAQLGLVVGVGDTSVGSELAATAGVPHLHRSSSDASQGVAGHVALVGGGPGAPGLLTRAGEDALRAAEVVLFDRLAPVSALRDLAPSASLIDVAKVPRGPGTSQERINELLVEHARAGRRVVRLKGGDPYVFGRGGEEAIACAQAGVGVSVIPGISSALSVPALAGIPLTHRGVSQGFSVVSGHLPPGHPGSTIDVAGLATSGTTIVLLMAVATLPDYCSALIAAGLDPQTPAATIADGSLAGQRSVRAPVCDLAEVVAAAGISAPAVTVIGAVAGLDLAPGGEPVAPEPGTIE